MGKAGGTIIKTAEMRWFWPTAELKADQSWFAGAGGLSEQEVRTDSYLVLPGCRTTGVKIRADLFEIKGLLEDAGDRTFATGQSGRLQRWVKWTHGAPAPLALQELHPSGLWLQVNKQRLRRRFVVAGETVSELGPSDAVRETGCTAELTEVSVAARQQHWLTFGFEANGPGGRLLDILTQVAGQFFRDHGDPPGICLTGANSFSYPGWLNMLLF